MHLNRTDHSRHLKLCPNRRGDYSFANRAFEKQTAGLSVNRYEAESTFCAIAESMRLTAFGVWLCLLLLAPRQSTGSRGTPRPRICVDADVLLRCRLLSR